jgi:steroid delta-isomerase-like uncharacterized protein
MAKALAAARRIFKAFETGNVADAADFIHPEYFNPDAADRSPAHGPDELTHRIVSLRSAFSELKFEERDSVAAGDKVAIRVVMSGRHTGSFLGHPATGRRFAAEQVHFFTVRDGKLLLHHAVRDDLTMHRQLGLFSALSET